MKVERNHHIPLYQQIKDYLDDLIASQALSPGERLPSEKELQDQLGVSRITVRHAMQQLEGKGKVIRVPGKGTFVAIPKVEPLAALTSFSENMRARGLSPSYRNARVEWIKPEQKTREALRLSEGEPVLHIHRLLLANEIPLAIQDAFLPTSIFAARQGLLTPETLNSHSLYELLEKELNIRLHSAEELVEGSVATREEARALEIAPGGLVLVITRTTRSDAQVPVEYVKLVFRADRYRYRVELFRQYQDSRPHRPGKDSA